MRLIRSGRSYQANRPPHNTPVTEELASELEWILERFARNSGFGPRERLRIAFGPGIVGHHQVGRAADIYEVGDVGLHLWFEQWRQRLEEASCAEPITRNRLLRLERQRNLGWGLYKSLQTLGRWARPPGFPVQLFGPWTSSEGPWRAISAPLQRAHFDHIHIAK